MIGGRQLIFYRNKIFARPPIENVIINTQNVYEDDRNIHGKRKRTQCPHQLIRFKKRKKVLAVFQQRKTASQDRLLLLL